MLSRKSVTSFTQVCSDPQVKLHLEFVFKGVTWTIVITRSFFSKCKLAMDA